MWVGDFPHKESDNWLNRDEKSVFPKFALVPLGKFKKLKKKKNVKGPFNSPLVVNLITNVNFYIYIFILKENKNLA